VPELDFRIEGAETVKHSVSPLLALKLRITRASGGPVRSMALKCQVRIESPNRSYDNGEKRRLVDLFGEPHRWSQTLRSLLWTNTSVVVSEFDDSTLVDLPIPCTFDFNVASAKFFDALESGDVPLLLLFSGTVFHENAEGALQVEQIPWDKEAAFRLPVSAWKEMMEVYYPNSAWLCLRKDVFDRLHHYKMSRGMATWEQTLESLLP
jgi:hypothetical protein